MSEHTDIKKIYRLSRVNGLIIDAWFVVILVWGIGFMSGLHNDIYMYIGISIFVLLVPIVVTYKIIEAYITKHMADYNQFIINRLTHGLTKQAKELIRLEDSKRNVTLI